MNGEAQKRVKYTTVPRADQPLDFKEGVAGDFLFYDERTEQNFGWQRKMHKSVRLANPLPSVVK